MVIALTWSSEKALIAEQEFALERARIDRVSRSRLTFCATDSGEKTEEFNGDTAFDEYVHDYINLGS